MIIGAIKQSGENRIPIVPGIISSFNKLGLNVCVESGAGESAFISDSDFKNAGAEIMSKEDLLGQVDILLSINPLSGSEYGLMKKGAIVVSSFEPFSPDKDYVDIVNDFPIHALSLDMIPRTSRAQSMDILSSMASLAGYKAVIKAAEHLPKYFPMLTTAAGTVAPAKVLVLGAGVAGLQAIATAKRLGAVVEAFDLRTAAKEEVESLGAKFVVVEGAKDDKGAGGYAVEQTEEYKKLQAKVIADHAAKSDVVITTALLRGKKAPLLIPESTIVRMKSGSVIVDLASGAGGNSDHSADNEVVNFKGVTIIGAGNLSNELPVHASELYAKNILNLLKLFISDGKIDLGIDDDIVQAIKIKQEESWMQSSVG
ncbi:NAD(P) transhydrogenase subunit alpha [Marinigracilibium pacificum]|uniref:proton-translocating NAD(P)(+) transhydrogenase n=1 Tax=Marinigracilibium pacificum TaxID=2729599 RepID=A0A848J1S1_9BACT|nr:NAD(P) transhydrogenase subunit alpha [Marinigracilibium pacificum]NMM50517.1 NAD(P) transhydrogenase subunit alpha [Marinigracilibium pacificum]